MLTSSQIGISAKNSALIVILGDQLSAGVTALKAGNPERDCVLMAEVMAEAEYVRHHKKKLAFVFSAMRHFAAELQFAGWSVDYVNLEDPLNTQSLVGEVARAVARHAPGRVIVTEPGEWRLMENIKQWPDQVGCPVDILEDDRFLCGRDEFTAWAKGRKQLRMEYFYREMRRKTGLLMDGDNPVGGKWNYDADNRKSLPPNLRTPKPRRHRPDSTTRDVIDMVEQRFAGNFGKLRPFWFAVDRAGAEASLSTFVADSLPLFGDFQDAMQDGNPFVFHSVLSIYINAGLLDPLETCRAVEQAFLAGRVPLNAAEGFIRQIIGWREYVRGIYWMAMPDYIDLNTFGADRMLPSFYWTADTDMACLKAALEQTRDEAYAHHIQRLMLTGNFAMLAGVSPRRIHEWYLSVYADAYEWVELPNTLGMSQFADGGIMASKPYASSGNYIAKMSNYCRGCRYDVRQKTGPDACPFNALYWDFLARNRAKLSKNPRIANAYRTWDRMAEDNRRAYRASADAFLRSLTTEEPKRLADPTSAFR